MAKTIKRTRTVKKGGGDKVVNKTKTRGKSTVTKTKVYEGGKLDGKGKSVTNTKTGKKKSSITQYGSQTKRKTTKTKTQTKSRKASIGAPKKRR